MKKALRTGSIEKAKALMIVLVGVTQAQSGQFDSTTRNVFSNSDVPSSCTCNIPTPGTLEPPKRRIRREAPRTLNPQSQTLQLTLGS